MFKINIFYLPVMPAQIYGRHILPKFRFTFMKNVNIHNSLLRSKLTDKIRSEVLLQKSGLKCLNEAVASITAVTVWKAKNAMDPLGQKIFREKSILQCTRSTNSKDIDLLVQGYPTLSTNIMARIWNAVPGLKDTSTLGAAKSLAKKWAKDIRRSSIINSILV